MGCQSDTPMTAARLQKELMGTYRVAEGVAYSMASSSFPEWLDRDNLGALLTLQKDLFMIASGRGDYTQRPTYEISELGGEEQKILSNWFAAIWTGERYAATNRLIERGPAFFIKVSTEMNRNAYRFYYIDGELYYFALALYRLERTQEAAAETRLFADCIPAEPFGDAQEYDGNVYTLHYPMDWPEQAPAAKAGQPLNLWISCGEESFSLSGSTSWSEGGEAEHWSEPFRTEGGAEGWLLCSKADNGALMARLLLPIPRWPGEPPQLLGEISMSWDCFLKYRSDILRILLDLKVK